MFGVALDGRRIKSPKGGHMQIPTEALAHMVAQEWDAQEEFLEQSDMHFTSLCNTALDNPGGGDLSFRVDETLEYFMTDTVMFRNDTYGEEFLSLQARCSLF
jgi:ATP synthase F1 complex assembly factor 2